MTRALLLRSVVAPALPFHFLGPICVVGRSTSCNLLVADLSVSRRHAEIRCGPDEVVLTDLGSRNGTYLEDQRITVCTVASGQQIRFGSAAFVLSVHETVEELDNHLDEETPSCKDELPMATLPMEVTPATALSPAQQRVFELLQDGVQEKSIARRLILSVHTVHNHVRAIYRAFNVRSRAELLVSLMRRKQTNR